MRKKLQTETAKSELIRWYQWEFLRRNDAYRSDYQSFMAEFGGWFRKKGFWFDEHTVYKGKDHDYFFHRICPRAWDICRRWQITGPIDPDWNFDRKTGLYEYKRGYSLYLPTQESAESAGSLWEPPETLEQIAESIEQRENAPPNPRYAIAKLDLERTTRDILRDVKREIDFGRRRYEKFLEQQSIKREPPRKRRVRLELYGRYLAVWDLRKRRLTFRRIAQQVYPEQHKEEVAKRGPSFQAWEHGMLPVIQKVMDHFCRAEALIAGEYKEIARSTLFEF